MGGRTELVRRFHCLIISTGAEQGVAGFGLATNPNFEAVLYDPSQPRNQRFSLLGTTIVARLYHSEATLLPVIDLQHHNALY